MVSGAEWAAPEMSDLSPCSPEQDENETSNDVRLYEAAIYPLAPQPVIYLSGSVRGTTEAHASILIPLPAFTGHVPEENSLNLTAETN
ncbi:hypothetical protein Pmani_019923 [Petrolisthes manimaculis]|uniref:Uncharacterized protein n=1 Tax=Petrolisthes manimaculis TaxID=1843537 RepID=A0AAE1U521_9EUCA|nr:hypothetical protein Pmani_019923 [Petrolisthes manimaculis]